MNDLDQFLMASASLKRGSLGESIDADKPTDRLAVYSAFEADRQIKAAQPDASPLVRWMLTYGSATAGEPTEQPSPFAPAGYRREGDVSR